MILPACADDAADTELMGAVTGALLAAADPDQAGPMQAYMQSAMPFYGIPRPALSASIRPLFAAWKPRYVATWRSTVLAMFRRATHREEWYAALLLLGQRRFAHRLDPDCLELCETLIVEGAWWDVVDEVASHRIQPLLVGWPKVLRPVLWSWASDPDRWLRRTSLICQLRRRGDTDLALLTHAVDQNLDQTDLFIRKAIGWALRDLGDHDPAWVAAFVAERRDRMATLSMREALRKQWAKGVALELKG